MENNAMAGISRLAFESYLVAVLLLEPGRPPLQSLELAKLFQLRSLLNNVNLLY